MADAQGWPEASDLESHIGSLNLGAGLSARLGEFLAVSRARFLDRAEPDFIPSDGTCTEAMRHCIVLYAGTLVAQEGGGGGVVVINDSESPIGDVDGILRDLERDFFHAPSPFPHVASE